MKLRNKKTGGLANLVGDDFFRVRTDAGWADYNSLAKLNEEWEDYIPSEPLIKDKKVRKAIREWADYNGVEEVFYFTNGEGGSRLEANYDIVIKFYNELTELKHWEKYTIAELCGEKEE